MQGQLLKLETTADKRRALALVEALDVAQQPMELVIRRFDEERSLDANRSYWSMLQEEAPKFGLAPEELHEQMLCAYFGVLITNVAGAWEPMPRRRTTTDEDGNRDVLRAQQWADYHAWSEAYVAYGGRWL